MCKQYLLTEGNISKWKKVSLNSKAELKIIPKIELKVIKSFIESVMMGCHLEYDRKIQILSILSNQFQKHGLISLRIRLHNLIRKCNVGITDSEIMSEIDKMFN